MTKHKRKIFLLILAVLVLIGNLFLLASCKEKEAFDTSQIEQATFQYNKATDTTKVTWEATLINKEIYNITSFSLTFSLYQNSVLVDTQTFDFEKSVKRASKFDEPLTFDVQGNINRIEFVSLEANYDTWWNAYWIWIIAASVSAVVLALIYSIVIIVRDVWLEDAFDFLVDEGILSTFGYILLMGSVIYGGIGYILYGSFAWYVQVIIILCGIVAFIVLALLGHLIRFIKEKIEEYREDKLYNSTSKTSYTARVKNKSTNTTITPSLPTHTPPTSSSNDDIGNNSSTKTTNNRVVSTTYEFPRTNSGTTISPPTSGYDSRASSIPSKAPTNSSSGSSSPTNSRNSGSSTPTNSRSSNNSPTNDRKVSNPVKSNDTTPVKADDNYPTN